MANSKIEIGKQIETLRKELGVSTYDLEQKGIHPSLPSTIEKGQKGYSIDSLIKYLNAINETYSERGKKRKRISSTGVADFTNVALAHNVWCYKIVLMFYSTC